MTYKAVRRSYIHYAAFVWKPNVREANCRKIQYTQNEALRIATGQYKISSIDHLHIEAAIQTVNLKKHSKLLSALHFAGCLEQRMLLLCLPTPLTLVCGRSPIIPLLVHQPAYLSIWPAAPSLQRCLSTNPGVTVWCV